MTSKPNTHPTTGPNIALSEDDRKLAEKIIEAIESLPTIDDDEVADRRRDQVPSSARWEGADGKPSGFLYERDKYELPALKLPGFGEAREDCGAEIPHFCEDCGEPIPLGRTCAQSMCPRCGQRWVTKTAPKHVGKVQEAAKIKSARTGNAVYKHHSIVSPPQDILIDADDKVGAVEEVIGKIMRAIDMDGRMYYHSMRGKNDDEGKDFASKHKDDRGEWKKRLFSGRNWEGDVREELEKSPHWHLVGACPWFPGGDVIKEVYERTGWVIHRITERNGSPVSIGDVHSLARVVTYCLSHTAVDCEGDRNVAQMTWRGSDYHKAEYRKATKQEARKAVHDVAPDTLGIASHEIECRNQFPEEDVDRDDVDVTSPSEADGDSADSSSSSDDNGMVRCRGDVVDIDDADDYLEDENWRQTAMFADDLEEIHRAWVEAGGWQGWIDQEQLTIDDVQEDPPPD